MRFLADESCDFALVRALRAAGHDVAAVAELSPQAEDDTVMERAVTQGRLLLTEDKDFGRLVYARARSTSGVLFLRFPARARSAMARTVVELVRRQGDRLVGRFVVVQPGRVRIRRTAES